MIPPERRKLQVEEKAEATEAKRRRKLQETRMNGLREDLRHALRVFWNAPSFAAAAVLTLALGIGVNIAVFTVMHSALARRAAGRRTRRTSSTSSLVAQRRAITPTSPTRSTSICATTVRSSPGSPRTPPMGVGVAAGPQTERVIAELVTANYFPLLGVDLPLGPGFAGADELQRRRPGGGDQSAALAVDVQRRRERHRQDPAGERPGRQRSSASRRRRSAASPAGAAWTCG